MKLKYSIHNIIMFHQKNELVKYLKSFLFTKYILLYIVIGLKCINFERNRTLLHY